MASINLSNLAKNKNTSSSRDYTYVDLHLDIVQQNRGISNTNSYGSIKGKDIIVDYDEAAIRNSITNILNTRQGQRFLIPTFGCNLLRYVGMPITDSTSKQIGNEILNAIRLWEPRVTIDQVIVIANEDQNEYNITVNLTIPALKKRDINILGTFTSQGILETRLI